MGRLGFSTILTQANGDCGIESLLVLADERRGPRERLALRRCLQQFLVDVSDDPAWHAAWVSAGETIPDPEEPASIHGGGGSLPETLPAVAQDASKMPSQGGLAEQKEVAQGQDLAPPKTNAAPIRLADETNPALRAAILWSTGLKNPTRGFLKRMAESLTAAEAERLIQEHTRDGGGQPAAKKGNGQNVKVGKKDSTNSPSHV